MQKASRDARHERPKRRSAGTRMGSGAIFIIPKRFFGSAFRGQASRYSVRSETSLS